MSDLLLLLAPELTLLTGAIVVLLSGLAPSPRLRGAAGWLAVLTVLAALLIAWNMGPPHSARLGMRFDDLSWYVRLIALSIGLLVLLIHLHLPAPDERGDMFAMILFSLLGILLTGLADDLVLLFLAMELVSVPTYVLVAASRGDIRAQEAGVKYFFLGALSSALMVYGFSFIYGASGTTALSDVYLHGWSGYLALGLVLAFAGMAFKIVAVPFHVYAADVYQGAASPVTGLLGFFPKVAGFVALVKLLWLIQPPEAVAAGWEMPNAAFVFLWVAAAATMTLGNVLGLMQTNVKRMLAYSSVAHSGYMLLAVLVGPVTGGAALRDGVSAMLFYIVVYGAMNLGVFAVLAMLRSGGRAAEALDDLAGLARQQPMAALGLTICVFSLLGMPPTAGFTGKVYIFTGALAADATHGHRGALMALAIIGLLNSAVAAAYYLRIVAACYLREPQRPVTIVTRHKGLQAGLVACCMAVLVLGLWPQGLISMARRPFHDVQPAPVLVERSNTREALGVRPETHMTPAPQR